MEPNFVVILVLIALLLGMSWRYVVLRRRLEHYAQAIRRASSRDKDSPPSFLLDSEQFPVDRPGLENLSNAVHSLAQAYNDQTHQLIADHERLSTLLDQITDGVLIADAQGKIVFCNPAVLELFGVSQVVGRSIAEVLRYHQLVETWRRSLQTGQLQSETVELALRRQYIQLIVIPDRSTPGTSLLLVQNLTRLRRLETVRRDFISNVSHELRTPLASLKALTETLQDGALDDPPAARRFVKRIETEVDALSRMASELLELSRIESGQTVLSLSNLLPKDLLGSVADRMRLQAERAGLTLQVDCPVDLPPVRGDLPRLEQVMVNLIHNAIKFTPPGGQVTLSACLDGYQVLFMVQDTGEGIPEEDQDRVFERFYRVDRSRTGAGTGLGLSIARHLVEAHGGKIGVTSREGDGSTFFFGIPLAM